ncbi:MAG: C25 family cysteine peptidase [Bacteroidetes bacterium]|nr:C25 family cysteine peptidase [Bacteroidota bacterium]
MKRILFVLTVLLFAASSLNAENYTYSNSWSNHGFNVSVSKPDVVQVVYSIQNFSIDPVVINGQSLQKVNLPGVFLFNDAGKPDLPGTGHYIAIPQGSTPQLRIVDFEVETIHGVDLAWAPEIPMDTQKDMVYSKDQVVYSTNAFYPASPVQISGVDQIRGSDVVMLGITPFQYNPVTKDLKIYRNIKINITFQGGNGTFGNDAFRSPYWDPIMGDNILNFSSLPSINYPERMRQLRNSKSPSTDECEYIIISPNGPDFLRWADTLKNFRNQQGILTKVFSLTEVGGNTESAIQTFIDNAYNNWTIKPVACLLLGDYGSDANKNITSHLYPHDAGYPNFASDNYYADVTGDEMPDIVFARICANDSSQLHKMVGRIMNFERNRPTDTGYYMHPISALGWQDDRWFQLCSELVGGFWKNVLGKHVQRINALGSPASNYTNGPWSTATNTNTVMNYFGPSGLNYIPTNPGTLGGFTGGTAVKINNAINAGAFILLHRDHGAYTLWGEPAYSTTNINQLTNTLLPFVFSINCETGAFHNPSGCPTECFQEVFQRLYKNGHDAGALGMVCPTETSYSFVNDAFLWGVFDNMWPQFMPSYGTPVVPRGILPAFGNAAGKYFLKASSWPYNTGNKQITYRLFHMHGDAFLQLTDTVPMNLTITHPATINYGTTTIDISGNDSAFLALSVNNEIIATAYGSASGPVTMTIPVLPVGTQIMLVATKQDYNRYTAYILVASETLNADFTASSTNICAGSSVNFTDLSGGTPTAWEWTFQGGNPGTSTVKDPSGIGYTVPGNYDVTLTVSKTGFSPSTTTKTSFIHVYEKPVAAFTATEACAGLETSFTDQSTHPGSTITGWSWNFGDPSSGSSNTSTVQNPVHAYSLAGTYTVTLNILSTGGCTDTKTMDVVIASTPDKAAVPAGNAEVCQGATAVEYTTTAVPYAALYSWVITPDNAGVITGTTITATLNFSNTFSGAVTVKVQASNNCGTGAFSDELAVTVKPLPGVASKPIGVDSVNTNKTPSSEFTTAGGSNASGYDWVIDPIAAGTITGAQTTGTALWTNKYSGTVKISVKAMNDCGDAVVSEEKTVVLYAPAGINDLNALGFEVYPNPTNGKFTIGFSTRSAVSVDITVFNSLGSSMFSEKDLQINGKFSRIIDFTGKSDGIYYIRIQSECGSFIRKLVIQK